MLLMSGMSWASRVTFRAFAPAAAPASSIALITSPRTANPTLNIGCLRADERRHRLDGGSIGLRLLENRQNALLDKLGQPSPRHRRRTQGHARRYSVMHSCFSPFSPLDRRGCGFEKRASPVTAPGR